MFKQQCLGDNVADVVIPSYSFSLLCFYNLSLTPYNDVSDVVSQALLFDLRKSAILHTLHLILNRDIVSQAFLNNHIFHVNNL